MGKKQKKRNLKGVFTLAKNAKKIAKKTASKAKKAAQLGVTAGKMISHLSNPANQQEMLSKLVRGKGLTYPGTKYIGPGNPMNLGSPTSKADELAFQHDKDYEDYLQKGYSPKDVYSRYSSADRRLYDIAKKKAHKSHEHLALTLGMGAKKLAHDLGVTKSLDDLGASSSSEVPLHSKKHKRHHRHHRRKKHKEEEYAEDME